MEDAFTGWLDRDPIAYHACRRPSALAAVELHTGERRTYAQLDAQVARTAGFLAARIPAPIGARIAYLGRNGVDQLAVMFACHRLGAVFVPLNWRLSPPEVGVLVEDCAPALLIADAEFLACAREAAPDTPLLERTPGLLDGADPVPAKGVDPHAPFVILYTSGTTGRPKGAVITRVNAFFGAFNFGSVGSVTPSSVMLCDAPMFHTVGLMAVARTATQRGAAVAFTDRFIPERTLKALSDPALGVTHYFAVPQIAQMLREHTDYTRSDLSRLVALFTGGAPMPPALIEGFLDDGVLVANGYGMTEVGTVLCMPLDRGLVRARLESAGVAAPAVRLRVVRGDGTDAPPGETGEIWLKGPGVMPGYWNRPEETARAFSDGWFRTGDAGLIDAEGYVAIIDRWKDMYISGGENVYPAEVEAVLLSLPGVLEAAVVGVPDPRWGETGLAFVALEAGTALPCEANLSACDGRLARYKHPRGVRILDALPRTASGKVRKDELRKLALT